MATEDNFEVEAILGECIDPATKKVLYEIKWKGYPDEENTWETREDLVLDGHEQAVLHYENQARSTEATEGGAPRSGKKKRESTARSKTPVKRTQATKSKTPGKKLDMNETQAGDANKTGADGFAQQRARDAKEIAAAQLNSSSRLVKFVVVGFVMSICLLAAVDADSLADKRTRLAARLLPAFAAVLLLQSLGTTHPAVNGVSKVAVWLAFSEFLTSSLIAPAPVLLAVIEAIWRYEAAKVAGASFSNLSVIIVSLVCWFLVSWEGSAHLSFDQVAAFMAFWGAVASVDRWTEARSVLNFFDAVGAGAALVACYTAEPVWRFSALAMLTLPAMLRNP